MRDIEEERGGGARARAGCRRGRTCACSEALHLQRRQQRGDDGNEQQNDYASEPFPRFYVSFGGRGLANNLGRWGVGGGGIEEKR